MPEALPRSPLPKQTPPDSSNNNNSENFDFTSSPDSDHFDKPAVDPLQCVVLNSFKTDRKRANNTPSPPGGQPTLKKSTARISSCSVYRWRTPVSS